MSREQIVRERQKRGLCTTCHDHPTQCFERVVPRGGRAARIVRILRGVALTPRNEEGVVRDGVCLRCNPPATRTTNGSSSSGSSGRQEEQHNEGGTRIERNAAEDMIMSREHSPGTTSRHHHTSGASASASNLGTSGSGSMGSGLGSGNNNRSENDPHRINVLNNIRHSITNMTNEADCAVNGAPPPSSAGSITASGTLLEREMSSPRTMPEAGTDAEGVGRRHHHNMERTETLSESGALAGCSSASAPQAQLDDSRQSSHSRAPPYHTAATEEYFEKTTTKQCHNILTVFQASPLAWRDDDHFYPVEQLLDFSREREIIIESFCRSRAKVRAVFETGTTEMLSDLLARGCRGETCQVLHFSCHGGDKCLYFEDGRGGAHVVAVKDLPDFIKAGGMTVRFVFIFACHSFLAGEAFLRAGARHVVCCCGEEKLSDSTVVVFCRAFYTALASAKTLKEAFELGKQAVKMSPDVSHSEEEMNKLRLLPEDVDCHNIPVFPIRNQQQNLTPPCLQQEEYTQPWILCHPPKQFIGREIEMYNVIGALRKFRLVRLIGPPGVGKTSLAAAVCQYIQPRRKSFDVKEIIWLPLTQPSNEDKLTTSLLLLFELLKVKGIHDFSANGEYCNACHTIIGALQRTKAVIVVDAQYLSFERLSMFLRELLQRTEHVRIILIKCEVSESASSIGVAETTIIVRPLCFLHSVKLFGAICPCISGSQIASTPSALCSVLVPGDEDEYCAGDEHLSERGEQILQFVGEGIPSKVIIAAEVVKNEWFNKLVELCMLEPKDFTYREMTELSELAGEMTESVKNREGIKKSDICDASSLPSLRETDGSSLEDDYLLVGVDFSTAFRDMDQDWAKNIVRQRKLIEAQVKSLLERSRRFTDMEDEPCQVEEVEVEYVEDSRRERSVVTLKMDIDIPSVGLDRLNRRKIQRCCQKIASLLRHAGVPDDELEEIMLGTLWKGSLNILLIAPSGVFEKLYSMILDSEKKIDLGDDAYLVSVRPAFMMKPKPISFGRRLRIDALRSISGNTEEERDELDKGDSLFLVPTSLGASANISTGVVALLGEKRERDWIDLLPFHYKKIGMCWEAVEDEKGSAGAVEAMEASVDISSAASVMEVAKAAEVKETATIATESTSETATIATEPNSKSWPLGDLEQKTDANVKARREKEGRCADCGLRTHKVTRSIFGRKKEPLTIHAPGGKMIAFKGRCLVCHPFPTRAAPPRPSSSSSSSDTSGGGGVAASLSMPASPSTTSSATSSSVPKTRPPAAPAAVAAPASPPKSGTGTSYRPNPLPRPAVVPASPLTNASASAVSGTTPPKLELRSAPPEIASVLLRLSTAATADDVATACADLGDLALEADNRVTIAAAGGVAIVVAAMIRHKESATVQEQACMALHNLAINDDNSVKIAAAGIRAVVAAMKRHAESAAVQEEACWVLIELAYNSDDNSVAIRKAGGIPAIVAAMERHEESAAVQEHACMALYSLSLLSSNVPLMRSEGVQQLLEDAKKRFPSQCDLVASLVLEKL